MNITRLSAAAAIVAATLGLAACGSDESEQPTEASDQPTVDLEAAPENASWSSVGGIGTPVDSNDGPEKTVPYRTATPTPRKERYKQLLTAKSCWLRQTIKHGQTLPLT